MYKRTKKMIDWKIHEEKKIKSLKYKKTQEKSYLT